MGKFFEFGFREQPAWIARIRAQVFDWRTTRLSACVSNRRFLADIAHECGQATSQSRVIRHCRS
jgi:hypothetical protein